VASLIAFGQGEAFSIRHDAAGRLMRPSPLCGVRACERMRALTGGLKAVRAGDAEGVRVRRCGGVRAAVRRCVRAAEFAWGRRCGLAFAGERLRAVRQTVVL